MISLTKNIQSESTLKAMISAAFPTEKCIDFIELTEGYFNVAYFVKIENGAEYILKIAPSKDVPVMSYEENMMHAEVSAMLIAKEKIELLVASVVFFDDSCTICSSPYFFMEKLSGGSFFSQQDKLSEEEKQKIRFETGKLNKQINSIIGEKFGYIGLPKMQGENWYEVFSNMINQILTDAERLQIDLKISPEKVKSQLANSRAYFTEITTPCLVHWDLWDGNVFVEDGKVTGLIDWERSLWADPLMEVGFRTYENNRGFMAGYGKEKLSETEYIRALWYDIYFMLIASQECDYRQYETRDMYHWASGVLVEKFEELTRHLEKDHSV